jgi:hypothetical protein
MHFPLLVRERMKEKWKELRNIFSAAKAEMVKMVKR